MKIDFEPDKELKIKRRERKWTKIIGNTGVNYGPSSTFSFAG